MTLYRCPTETRGGGNLRTFVRLCRKHTSFYSPAQHFRPHSRVHAHCLVQYKNAHMSSQIRLHGTVQTWALCTGFRKYFPCIRIVQQSVLVNLHMRDTLRQGATYNVTFMPSSFLRGTKSLSLILLSSSSSSSSSFSPPHPSSLTCRLSK